ncbi:3-hydroxy-3-methylglutaryl-coenzyme A reductase-like isoform X2 [Oscarella lobularis]
MGFVLPQSRVACSQLVACQTGATEEVQSSDVIIMSLTHCLAVLYIYMQFTSLRDLGSSYLLGIAGVFTIFSSFVFSAGVVAFLGKELTGLNQALPFFLLLIDLSKAGALAKFGLCSTNTDDLRKNIAHGISMLGPNMTIDTLVKILVICVGTLTGISWLSNACCFGALSIFVNYIVFMSFYPAALALFLEMSHNEQAGRPAWQIELASVLTDIENEDKNNPVSQNIKLIMSVGLAGVHIYSWKGFGTGLGETTASFHSNYGVWSEFIGIGPDKYLAICLFFLLTAKFLFWDSKHHTKPSVTFQDDALTDVDQETVAQVQASGLKARKPDGNLVFSRLDFSEVSRKSSLSSIPENEPVPSTPDGSKSTFLIGVSESESDAEEERASETETAVPSEPRPVEKCLEIFETAGGVGKLTNAEIVQLIDKKHLQPYNLERDLGNPERGVAVRRMITRPKLDNGSSIDGIPYAGYDYSLVMGACCENVIGYMPVPLGVAGPLRLDGKDFMIPMATTEGCLVASTNRGCSALRRAGGVTSSVVNDGMTRAPVVRFPSAKLASEVKRWLQKPENFAQVKSDFDSTSRFARLQSISTAIGGRLLFIRFKAVTGDAMGMNMVSKGAEKALAEIQKIFPDMEIVSLSGNFCTDKKPSAVNWIEGRGKSVVCEAIIPSNIVTQVLKTSVPALVELSCCKNLIGSSMAGSIGGFNAHAANIVAAIFIAAGQDPAQVVCSSNCMTLVEPWGPRNEDLYMTCTMPSIEVGTVGGGTLLPGQRSCLEMLGVYGPNADSPGENAASLARVVCGAVLAGELSLMSALAAGHLVKSHLKHNRSSSALIAGMKNTN